MKSWRTSRRRQLLEGQGWQLGTGSGLGRTTEVQLHSPSFFFFSILHLFVSLGSFFKNLFIFNWKIIVLQYCVGVLQSMGSQRAGHD